MTDYQRYIAEEVAVDHADGIISRREAGRRLGPLGLSAAAAAALLTGTANTAAGAPPGSQRRDEKAVDWAPVPTENITFPGPNGTLMAAWAPADGTRPLGSVLVMHENRGLTDHIRSVAGRFAASGYSAPSRSICCRKKAAPGRSRTRPRWRRRWPRSRRNASTPT